MQQPGEVASLQYHFLPDTTAPPFPSFFNMQQNDLIPSFHFSSFFMPHPVVEFPTTQHVPAPRTPQAPCASNNNSTSDEADQQQQQGLIDERKRRRMISNRESARRSRMRKQKHLDELWSQVVNLRTLNRQLIDELNRVIGDLDHILQDNSRLRDEASVLRNTLHDLKTKKTCRGAANDQDLRKSTS